MNQLPRLKFYKLQYTLYVLFLINNLRLYQKLCKKLDCDLINLFSFSFFLVFWWFCKWNQFFSLLLFQVLLKDFFLITSLYIKNNHPSSKTNGNIFFSISFFFFTPYRIYTRLDYTVISTGRILCTEDTCCDTTKAKYGIQLQIYNYDMTFNKQYHCVEDRSPLSKSSVFILNYFEWIQGIYSIITDIYI